MYTTRAFLQDIKEEPELKDIVEDLINKLSEMIENTDFKYLYSHEQRLFSIGFNIEDNKLTDSYYDLLASEARQASLVAIAKKDIPVKNWSNLSRTLTVLRKYKGLISWSGTAFEYLMPNINIKRYNGSLLDESCKFLIMNQIEYSKKLGIPWGISEAAFNLKDLHSNYQYKAFGIPWLGLKRGLADEMVVSSYGSILAITDVPKQVTENLKILKQEGMYDKYGFYESIDYTPERVSKLIAEADWQKVDNMTIPQPESKIEGAGEGDQYVVLLQKTNGNEVTTDAQFLTASYNYEPSTEKEKIITQETTRLPITYDSIALIVALVIVVGSLTFVAIRMKKVSKKNEE